MKPFVIAGMLCAFAARPARPSEQGQLDASPALFAVLAAINAAGYDTELDSPNTHPLRAEVRRAVAAAHPPALAELRRFFAAHRQDNPTAELSQYISLALSVTGPPEFALRFKPTEIPPDVRPLHEELLPLIRRFSEQAGVAEIWKRAQPAFEEALERYHEPLSQAILQANAYLRNPTAGYLGRRFQVYLDLLGAPNQVQTRSYADEYFVVVTASTETRIADVRHAYLHYLLDPLATKYGMELMKRKALGDYAQPAGALDPVYKSDFLLLATECLIKALETRLPGSKTRVEEAVREGYILTPFFSEQLTAYERQLDAMRLFFPEMVKRLDPAREDRRLAGVEFAASPRERAARMPPGRREGPPASLTSDRLEEADRLFANRDLESARQAYLRVLKESTEAAGHARAYYGLARIAVLQNDPETGERLFRKALESSPEPHVEAWAHVYLGRLSDIAGDRTQAVQHYQTALAVHGASAQVRREAEKGVREASQKPQN